MVLDSFRPSANKLLDKMGKPFIRFNPNAISVISFIFALLSGVTIYIGGIYLIFAFISILLSATFDALDGFVARKTGKASKAGDFLDHTLDRLSDIAILAGFSFSAMGSIYIGFFAITGVLMTSYMGTQAQSVGLKRNYRGVLGRADRLLYMMIFIIVALLYPYSYTYYLTFNPFTTLLMWFAVAGYVTAISRFTSSYRELSGAKGS